MGSEDNKIKYVTSKKALEKLGISIVTLRTWANKGKIEFIKSSGGHRLYNLDKYLCDNLNSISRDDSDNNDTLKILKNKILSIKKKSKNDDDNDNNDNDDNDDDDNDDDDNDNDNDNDDDNENINENNDNDNNDDDNDDNDDKDDDNKKNRYLGRLKPNDFQKNNSKSKKQHDSDTFDDNDDNNDDNNNDNDDEHPIFSRYVKDNDDKKQNIIYFRIPKKEDVSLLETQYKFIRNKYPKYDIIIDIGSGLDFNRKGFIKIFNMILNNKLNNLIVSNKNSLITGGYDFLKKILNEKNGKLSILENNTQNSLNHKEMIDDLHHIISLYE